MLANQELCCTPAPIILLGHLVGVNSLFSTCWEFQLGWTESSNYNMDVWSKHCRAILTERGILTRLNFSLYTSNGIWIFEWVPILWISPQRIGIFYLCLFRIFIIYHLGQNIVIWLLDKENFSTKTPNVTQGCLFNIITYDGIKIYLKYFNSL